MRMSRPVSLAVGETAPRVVELHGRHAEVEQHAVDARMPDVRQHVGQPVVDGVHQVQPRSANRPAVPGCAPAPPGRGRARPASSCGWADEQRLSVSAETDGRVDDHRRVIGEGGREQREDPIEQYRDMTDRSRVRRTHGAAGPLRWYVHRHGCPWSRIGFNAAATSPVGADAGRRLGSPPVVRATCLGPGKVPQGRDGRDGGRPERTS